MDTEMNSLQTVDAVADTSDLPVAEVNDTVNNSGISTMGKIGIIGGALLGLTAAGYGVYKLIKHIKAKKQNAVEVEEAK